MQSIAYCVKEKTNFLSWKLYIYDKNPATAKVLEIKEIGIFLASVFTQVDTALTFVLVVGSLVQKTYKL